MTLQPAGGVSSVGLAVLLGTLGLSLAGMDPGGVSALQGFALGALGPLAVLIGLVALQKSWHSWPTRDADLHAENRQREDTGRRDG
jgi:hypothetical protein